MSQKDIFKHFCKENNVEKLKNEYQLFPYFTPVLRFNVKFIQ